jgi:CheY-like chemotaxis protein
MECPIDKQIVVVDDDTTIIKTMKLMLKKFDTVTFLDPEDALDYIEKNIDNIEMCLLDLMMPKINGYELACQIREIDKSENIKVIIVTGDVSFSVVRPSEILADERINGYMLKPFTLDKVNMLTHPDPDVRADLLIKNFEELRRMWGVR